MQDPIYKPNDKIDNWETIEIHSRGKNGGRINWKVKCKCGYEKIESESNLKRHNSLMCATCRRNDGSKADKRYLNKKFGKLTPIKRVKRIPGCIIYQCRCECGNIKNVRSSNLRNGTKSCNKCESYKDITATYWKSIVESAIKRKINIDITIKQVYQVFEKQNKRCALTNLPIYFAKTARTSQKGFGTASLDRINSFKGYTIDNIQWVHKVVNICKWKLNNQDFINMCNMVAKNNFCENTDNWTTYKQTSGRKRDCGT